MDHSYEDHLFTKIKYHHPQTPYAILIAGRKECIPDLLTLLSSLKLNLDLNLYTIIYFYQNYNDKELELIQALHSDIILVDIDQLSKEYSFLNSFKLLGNGRWGSPVGAKFYSFKLLELFKTVVYLDRDTVVIKDFTQYLKTLENQHADIAVLPCTEELNLFFKKHHLIYSN